MASFTRFGRILPKRRTVAWRASVCATEARKSAPVSSTDARKAAMGNRWAKPALARLAVWLRVCI
jgi:hypothetical protein